MPVEASVPICASLADCLAMLPCILAKLADSIFLDCATLELYLIICLCNSASLALEAAILYAVPLPATTPDFARATRVVPSIFLKF